MIFNVGKNGGVVANLVFEDKLDNKYIEFLNEKGIFSGKKEEIYINIDSDLKENIYIGMGKEDDISYDSLRRIFFQLGNKLVSHRIEEIELNIPKLNNLCNYRLTQAISEGLLHSTYSFEEFKTNKKDNHKEIIVNYIPMKGKEEKAKLGIEESQNLMNSIFLARDLVNRPSNIIYPESLAKIATDTFENTKACVKVYDKNDIENLGMKAFLEVSRGSSKEPKLIVIEFLNNVESDERVALVGKGITYDSGGYAIKPVSSMIDMHSDMAGAATVIGAMKSLVESDIKTNVVGIIAACENMISGNSYKNGDIIESMSGKTIEIVNTDAEGRLTLADAVHFAGNNIGANKIIDIATLTGSCVSAFGEHVSASITNSEEFYTIFENASKIADEIVWKMPNIDYYRDMNKSSIADIKNSGGRLGGVISAGQFIEFFVDKKIDWIHIDIAGTSYLSKSYGYQKKGGTGVLVKTLYYLLRDM